MITARNIIPLCIWFCWLCCFTSCSTKHIAKSPQTVFVDHDGDGVTDDKDKCPDVAGLPKYDGCPIPDRDNDGINDEQDKCPDAPGTVKYNGCPVPDSDGDGIDDEHDKCPDTAGIIKLNGCPVPDADGDGIDDEHDKCPDVRGSLKNEGCPNVRGDEEAFKNPDSDGDGIPDSEDQCPDVKGNKSNNGCPGNKPVNTVNVVAATTGTQSVEPGSNSTAENGQAEIPGKATLGFSYYPVIKKNETRDLRVTVIINGTGAQVKNKIRTIEKEELQFTELNDSSIVCIVNNIEAYKKLKISLVYDKKDFTITPVNTEEEQELDFVNGNNWHWKVRAESDDPHNGNITLLINAETPDGIKHKISEKQVNIKIVIDDPVSFLDQTGNWIGKNIQFILSAMVIPFVIFIYNKRKKKDEERKKGDNTNAGT
ncbi:MAG TPA: thrombospondin type 3 repeat-containing protein [Panacibacter sp.]|nr:thrombospondin type 3 repeat-containing protein [Panacibacter sp.]